MLYEICRTPRWQQVPKGWEPGRICPCHSEAVIGGRHAKTTPERAVYPRGRAVHLTTALEDVMATMGWAVVLPACEQPRTTLLATPACIGC